MLTHSLSIPSSHFHLWAGGLRDLPDAVPGRGYTGHSFNDYNHCDLTTMLDNVAENENRGQARDPSSPSPTFSNKGRQRKHMLIRENGENRQG